MSYDPTTDIGGAYLRLSAQRALLGEIGIHILGICIQASNKQLNMTVFCEEAVTEDERDSIDAALASIEADTYPALSYSNLNFIIASKSPLEAPGSWVFLRLGYAGRSPNKGQES